MSPGVLLPEGAAILDFRRIMDATLSTVGKMNPFHKRTDKKNTLRIC
jgi:hypothetical protein